MRVVYIANDGTEFDDQWGCEAYEAGIKHTDLLDIEFYDVNDQLYQIDKLNILDEWVYCNAEKVVIPTQKAYDDFAWLTEETGWCEWEDIAEPGIWVRHEDERGNAEWRKICK